jgi:hypothetical protein
MNGTYWSTWKYCVSKTSDEKTLLLSRGINSEFLRTYDLQNNLFSPCFESPEKDNFSPVYHVIHPKIPNKCYVAYHNGIICEYNLNTGRILRKITVDGYPDKILASNLYNKIYICCSRGVCIWNLDTNKVSTLGNFDNDCLALNLNENLLAVSNRNKNVIVVFDSKNNSSNIIKSTGKIIHGLQFTNDSKYLVSATSKPSTVSLHYLRNGETRWTIIGFEKESNVDVFFNKDETLMFLIRGGGNKDWQCESIIVFDTETLLPVYQIRANYPRNALLSQDEKYIFVPGLYATHIYQLPDREQIKNTLSILKNLNNE